MSLPGASPGRVLGGLASQCLDLWAHPGLALFYGGLVRSKNVLSVMNSILVRRARTSWLQRVGALTTCSSLQVIAALVSVEWVLYAFSIAFDTGGMVKGGYNLRSFFGSLGNGGLHNVHTHRLGPTTYPLNTLAMFQLTFAIITVAIISGAYVERMKHSAVMLFSSLWLVAVYCPLAHMVWSGDGAFLHDLGVLDFAGGLVVHTSSGVAGLVCALCIRARTGYPRIPKAPHSLVLTHIGAAFLWVGWFGFNAGSAGAADFSAAQALMVTQVASSAGVLAWSTVEWALFKRPSSLGMLSGALAGLVGITPASGSSGVYGALFIGSFCAIATFLASTRLKEWMGACCSAPLGIRRRSLARPGAFSFQESTMTPWTPLASTPWAASSARCGRACGAAPRWAARATARSCTRAGAARRSPTSAGSWACRRCPSPSSSPGSSSARYWP